MPKSFSLDFDNGLHVIGQGEERQIGGLIGSVREDLELVWPASGQELFQREARTEAVSELELIFANEKDAQAIYWIFLRRH